MLAAPTALHLSGCSGNPDVTLMRFNGSYFQPLATKRFYCLNTDGGWQSWGRQRAGDYRFEFNPRTANGRLTVSYFHGGW